MKFKKVIIGEGEKYFYDSGDVHTEHGVIKEADILKNNQVKSSKGKTFNVIPAGFNDLLEKIKRGPQIMIHKDIGMILAYTNINKDSLVVDAGSGCGVLALHLSRFVKHVYSYEIREDHHEIAKKNIQLFGVTNITLKNRDINNGIQEKNLDLVILDLADPEKVKKKVSEALRLGGYLVVYVPQITQVKEFVESSRGLFFIEKTIEVLERSWKIEGDAVHPKSISIGHTAFITFCRKL